MLDPADLARWWQAGREAWPEVDGDPEGFAGYLAERAALAGAEDPAAATAALERLCVGDLYLAHALIARRPGAAEAFHARVLPAIDPALRHLGGDTTRIDEIRQVVVHDVIVGGARGPALLGYAGRSDLRGWLRAVAVRIALKAWGRDKPGEPIEDWEELGDLGADPWLQHLKSRYADEVSAAFREAIGALSARQRMLLRFHHLDGLTVDDLARMYNVHRATAARWVAAAREAVFEETRLRLHDRLGVDDSTAVSVVKLVQSQLVNSLRRLLS